MRLAYHIIDMDKEDVRDLAESIFYAKQKIHYCAECGNFSSEDLCPVCADSTRDRSSICVVRDPRDVLALERAQFFKGVYHVLHGTISPMNNIGPEDIRIRPLIERLENEEVKEVILATNPDVEGDATAVYISRLIKPLGVRVSRIAHGIPLGGELEYTDELTLGRALENRREM